MDETLQTKRAHDAWPILVKRAKSLKGPMTYGQLAIPLHVHPHVCSYFLGKIQDFCARSEIPPLQVLVVNGKTEIPGPGYIGSPRTHRALAQEIDRVKSYPWETIPNPF